MQQATNPPLIQSIAPVPVPDSLRVFPQWVCFKFETGDKGKLKKVPYNSKTGDKAKSNDAATWHSYTAAMQALTIGGYDGIGFMLANDFCGVDLDHCRNKETGEINEFAMTIVEKLNSYTEISPSGTGLHIFTIAQLAGKGINREVHGHKIEIYDSGRFFTFTGNHLEGTPFEVNERQAEVDRLYESVVQESKDKQKPSPTPVVKPTITATIADNDVMDLAINSANGAKFERLWDGDSSGYKSDSEADLAFVAMLCFWTQDDVQVERLWQLSKRYRAKLERSDYISRTIEKARELQKDSYTPKAVVTSEVTDDDDPPISNDAKRESYLRQLWAHHNRVNRAMMYMLSALGFGKVPMRLINAIHGLMRNRLGVVSITNEKLQELYSQAGESADSLGTVRVDKEKLWQAQQQAEVELIWYWHGRKNPETGEPIASRYKSHLARWTLEAIDLCIERYGYRYSDAQLQAACTEIAATISNYTADERPSKTTDGHSIVLKGQDMTKRGMVKVAEGYQELEYTKAEREIHSANLLAQLADFTADLEHLDRKRFVQKVVEILLRE